MSKVSGSSTTNRARTARTNNANRVENKDAKATVSENKAAQTEKTAQVEKKPASVDDVRASRTRAASVDKSKQAALMQQLDKKAQSGLLEAEAQLKNQGIHGPPEADKFSPDEAQQLKAGKTPERFQASGGVENSHTAINKENQAALDEAAKTAQVNADENPGTAGDTTVGEATTKAVTDANETYGTGLEQNSAEAIEKRAELSKSNVYTAADPSIMEGVKAGEAGALTRGHKGAGVTETQASLNKLGFGLREDGMLGPRTEAAVKQFQKAAGLPETGQVDAATHSALQEAKPEDFKGKITPQDLPPGPTSVSGAKLPSGERAEMIRNAILNDPKIPDSWATDPSKMAAINRIVEKESGWRVGIPNYTIRNAGMTGDEAAKLLQTNKNLTKFGASSSAMGLFQLLGTNMDKYQPGGRTTIGNAQAEMQGGLRYMMDRYGDPERALAFHNSNNWW